MRNWKIEPFEGTLLQIIEDCAPWLPTPWNLAHTQSWLIDQLQSAEDNPAILLPVRRFKGQDFRGSSFDLDGCRFVPVDNEPATALFELIRLNGFKVLQNTTLQELLDNRTLPVSWSCDEKSPTNSHWRFGRANAEFRNVGLKLAHIFDASQKSLCRDTADGCLPRFFRTMNPVNCFPFPGVKEVKFGGDLEGDLAENPIVQKILRGFMMEYLDNADAVSDWLHYSDVELTDQQLNKPWRLEARSIQLTITPKISTEPAPAKVRVAPGALDDFEEHAAPKITPVKAAIGLKQLGTLLADWTTKNPDLDIRLDGKPSGEGGNRTAWIFFRVQHFTGEHEEWNGVYRFHGDTTIHSLQELVDFHNWAHSSRPSADELAYTIQENLQPAWTRTKNRSLTLKGHTKPDGFYCFQV